MMELDNIRIVVPEISQSTLLGCLRFSSSRLRFTYSARTVVTIGRTEDRSGIGRGLLRVNGNGCLVCSAGD